MLIEFLFNYDTYRSPSAQTNPLTRDKWINAIQEIQPFDIQHFQFVVCITHFRHNDLIGYRNQFKLAPNAVPSIFETNNENTGANDQNIHDVDENEGVSDIQLSTNLQAKIDDLTYELMITKSNFDIEKQCLSECIKKANLKFEKHSEQLKELSIQLKRSREEAKQLQNKIDAMKNQRNFISEQSGVSNV